MVKWLSALWLAGLCSTLAWAEVPPASPAPLSSAPTNPALKRLPTVWNSAGVHQGIALYTQNIPGQDLKAFKGSMDVPAGLSQVTAALADLDSMHEWFFLLEHARFLGRPSLENTQVYLQMRGIWPVSARDVVAQVHTTQHPRTLAIHMHVVSAAHLLPEQPGFVRIPALLSIWTLTPLPNGHTRVDLEGQADPGGWIPLTLANFMVTTLPRETLMKLRQHMQHPDYRDPATLEARLGHLRHVAAQLRFPDQPQWPALLSGTQSETLPPSTPGRSLRKP